MNKFYVTTTLPYVNADPHIGFALEIIQADVLARFYRLKGFEVFFNTGTDEHGTKIYRKAIEEKKDIQEYVDKLAIRFDDLKNALNLSYNSFIRTSDPKHHKASQIFWKRCLKNDDIYKAKQKIKYCVGCELEKTDSELVNNKCTVHPKSEIEVYEEENYFFRFSKYEKPLLELYEKNPEFVIPSFRLNEIKNFVSSGLKDFSISRLKKKMPWGVPVPGDEKHVMYVWFDALINYISAIGWPEDEKSFRTWWPVVQLAGKDNLRQQSAMWQAMLLSAGLPNSKQILIHGFITVDGQKISKSLGNVVDPFKLVEKYSTDAVRYYLLREIPAYGDGDFSERRFKELYNADLANGLGNLVSRVAKLCEGKEFEHSTEPKLSQEYKKNMQRYKFSDVLSVIGEEVRSLDKYINEKEPWKIEDEKKLVNVMQVAVNRLITIGYELQPFLPATSQKILKQFGGSTIKSQKPYFKRIN